MTQLVCLVCRSLPHKDSDTDVVETDVTQTVDNANSKQAVIVVTAGKTKSCPSAQVKALKELSISFQPARASSANIPCLPRTTGKTAWTR